MRGFLLTAAAAFLAAAPALAQDAARGRDLAGQACVACHGENGRSSTPGIPSLAGQLPDFTTTQLILFREGLRQVPAMQAASQGLSDSDIEDLAAHFAALPPGPPEDRGPRDAALAARGEELAGRMRCGICHLPGYVGRNQIPRLVAQREDFLAHTLAEYRDGKRVGADPQMNGAVVGISDADIAALAHYLAQLN